jgi:hypothetical protein
MSLRQMAGSPSRVAGLLSASAPATPRGHGFSTHDLHVEGDLICPRCLGWISRTDIVRRTAYGPFQHEACPTE